ncbi:DUF6933 domain-containing protein [Bacillus sp. UNC41MFS5]|uniref:DUF6933 domain-containing protein n=1 Tax=Bacillus sp. UNC41MFS5 TaxID=1449046 RepID=UPI00069034D3|nr:hypothetical protein [Bacillus sp. UNC41MFS5]
MFIIGATQKVLKELQITVTEDVKVSKSLNEWHLNLFKIGRYQCLILINDFTLYSVVIPGVKKKDLANIGAVFSQHLAENLLAEGIEPVLIEKFLEQGNEIVFTKTHNRSVVGVIVEIVKFIQFQYPTGKDILAADPVEINKINNGFIYSPTEYAYPNKMIKEEITAVYSQPI